MSASGVARWLRCNTRRLVFFFNDTATTEIYTLSLHDALPISRKPAASRSPWTASPFATSMNWIDRKSTRLNSSHLGISYAVFCLKKRNPDCSLELHGAATVRASLGGSQTRTECLFHACRSPLTDPDNRHFFFLKLRPPPEISPFPHPAPFRY